MKSLKKALAVLLSVLMVVFSFPLSALALPNPDNDGRYPEDYDVEFHMYAIPYTSSTASLGYLNDGTTKLYDIHDMTMEEIRADMDADTTNLSTVGYYDDAVTFALVFTLENADGFNISCFALNYDSDYIQPAKHDSAGYLYTTNGLQGTDTNATLAPQPIYDRADLDTDLPGINAADNTSWLRNGPLMFITNRTDNLEPSNEQTSITVSTRPARTLTFDGTVMAVFGFQLLQDCDLTDVITVDPSIGRSYISTQLLPVQDDYIGVPGCYDAYGTPLNNTVMALPDWDTAEEPEPEDVTYTYHFADGSSQEVTAPSDVQPTPPENTADTEAVSNNNGTHTYTTYSWPDWVSGTTDYTEQSTVNTVDCDMEETAAQVDPIHADGIRQDGTTAVETCSVCGYKTGGDPIPASEHTYALDEGQSTAATCVAQGTEVWVCSICGDSYTEYTEIDPNNHANVVTDEAVAPTCTDTGLTEGSHCEACSTVIVAQETVDALGHDYQYKSTTATCVTPGDVIVTCSRCDYYDVQAGELNPDNHEGDIALDPETVVEATRGEDGYTGDYVCSACHNVVTSGETIPALGVQITVTQNELGSTTLNGDATTGTAQKVAYEESYTLTAEANEGAEFVGWQVAGKLVSTDATYTTTAYADLTYVPVFAEAADEFTVTFIDQFNKVIGTYTNTEIAEMEALPEAQTYLGYTFDGWSMTLEEVKALEANAIVTASYTKSDELTYTVSAPGCIIRDVAAGVEAEDTLEVTFDTMVKVTPAEGEATSWTVNGANAAYGSEYTFYVTSDVTVGYDTEAVTAAPTVAAVDMALEDDYHVRFLATRSVPEGYTLVESGFVYGKGMAEEDLVLENVGTVQGTANGTVKLIKNSNMAGDGQFALTYGVTAKDAAACARAYVIATDAEGNTAVYYADAQIYNYTA